MGGYLSLVRQPSRSVDVGNLCGDVACIFRSEYTSAFPKVDVQVPDFRDIAIADLAPTDQGVSVSVSFSFLPVTKRFNPFIY